MADPTSGPRFPKPKILLVDLPKGAATRLSAAGFNVRSGTFGRPYSVPKRDAFVPVIPRAHLPNYTEQEIVIVDLATPDIESEGSTTRQADDSESDVYAHAGRGVIDPRPRVMVGVTEVWDRILDSGGTFVVFAEPRQTHSYTIGTVRHQMFDRSRELQTDNWSFLSILSRETLKIEYDHGTETKLSTTVDFINEFLRHHQTELTFEIALTPMFHMTYESSQYEFIPLLHSKYDECVGCIITAKKPKKGRILILRVERAMFRRTGSLYSASLLLVPLLLSGCIYLDHCGIPQVARPGWIIPKKDESSTRTEIIHSDPSQRLQP